MIDIEKSEFEVENIKLANGLTHMQGAVVYRLLSNEGVKKLQAGEKDIFDKDYHIVLMEEVEKIEPEKKVEAPKQDIMRKNKKVID